MAQLPLALPQCRRFLGVLAALAQLPKSDASALQLQSHEVCYVEAEKAKMMVSVALAVALVTMTVMFVCRAMLPQSLVQPITIVVVDTRSVGTQSQTTYTSLRGNLTPRFLPLPEHSHG